MKNFFQSNNNVEWWKSSKYNWRYLKQLILFTEYILTVKSYGFWKMRNL